MRKLARVGLTIAMAAGLALAAGREGEEQGGVEFWRIANFLLLVVGLGYLGKKYGGPFFAARSENIQRAMTEAQAVRRDAEEKFAAVEARLANLEAEIAGLRQESEREIKANSGRMAQEAAATFAKVEASLYRDIEEATKAAAFELRRHAARLAMDLAEHKVRARLTPQTEDGLVQGYVTDLRSRPAPGSSN